jgi:hypothetical protein
MFTQKNYAEQQNRCQSQLIISIENNCVRISPAKTDIFPKREPYVHIYRNLVLTERSKKIRIGKQNQNPT